MSEFIQLSFLMCVAHFLCDYPLQGDWLAKAKNPMLTPVEGESIWKGAMAGHCAFPYRFALYRGQHRVLGFRQPVAL
jgi:hypothetical protein